MCVLRTLVFGAVLIVMVLTLGVMEAQPTVPTRHAPIPRAAENEKDEPFEYEVGGVAKKATRRVRTVEIGGGSTIRLVRIKAGAFRMGSPKDAPGRGNDEAQHEVTLTSDYYLGLYAVTRGQFRAFVDDAKYGTEAESEGSGGTGWDATANNWKQDPKYTWLNADFAQTDDHPVVNVSWNDAVAFCAWLNKKGGKTFRLPSEAEWEYACRAGATTTFSFGDDAEGLCKYANVADKAFREATGQKCGVKGSDGHAFTAPVGKFVPNAWGLHDMHGNAWQWCADYYGPYDKISGAKNPLQSMKQDEIGYRVSRGGSWGNWPRDCRAAGRNWGVSAFRDCSIGFRVCYWPE